jgi:hypothetical protein
LRAFLPAHPQRISQHDFLDFVLADGPFQPAKVSAIILPLQRLNSLRRDAQRIGNGQPHAAAAVINGQNASGGSHCGDYTSFRISPIYGVKPHYSSGP